MLHGDRSLLCLNTRVSVDGTIVANCTCERQDHEAMGKTAIWIPRCCTVQTRTLILATWFSRQLLFKVYKLYALNWTIQHVNLLIGLQQFDELPKQTEIKDFLDIRPNIVERRVTYIAMVSSVLL